MTQGGVFVSTRGTVMVVALAVALSVSLSGCTPAEETVDEAAVDEASAATTEVDATLVWFEEGTCGPLFVIEGPDSPLLVGADGAYAWVDGRLERTVAYPEGLDILDRLTSPEMICLPGNRVLARRPADDGGLELLILDLLSGETVSVLEADSIVLQGVADLMGDDVPEIVVMAGQRFRDTGTPLDFDERIDVLSLEGDGAHVAWSSAEGEPQVRTVGAVQFADTGVGDDRPELMWTETAGEWYREVTWRLRVASPADDFSETCSESYEGVGVATLLGESSDDVLLGVRVSPYAAPAFEQYLAVGSDGRITEPPVDPAIANAAPHRHGGTADLPLGPLDHVDAGALVDLDGDGYEDSIVAGGGEPGLCKCTPYTAYVGWAFGEEGGLGDEGWTGLPVDYLWSDGLESGFGELIVEDLDGDGDQEIIVRTESGCFGGGVWVIEPGRHGWPAATD